MATRFVLKKEEAYRSLQYTRRAQVELETLLNQMKFQGLSQGRRFITLQDGTTIECVSTFGQSNVYINPRVPQLEQNRQLLEIVSNNETFLIVYSVPTGIYPYGDADTHWYIYQPDTGYLKKIVSGDPDFYHCQNHLGHLADGRRINCGIEGYGAGYICLTCPSVEFPEYKWIVHVTDVDLRFNRANMSIEIMLVHEVTCENPVQLTVHSLPWAGDYRVTGFNLTFHTDAIDHYLNTLVVTCTAWDGTESSSKEYGIRTRTIAYQEVPDTNPVEYVLAEISDVWETMDLATFNTRTAGIFFDSYTSAYKYVLDPFTGIWSVTESFSCLGGGGEEAANYYRHYSVIYPRGIPSVGGAVFSATGAGSVLTMNETDQTTGDLVPTGGSDEWGLLYDYTTYRILSRIQSGTYKIGCYYPLDAWVIVRVNHSWELEVDRLIKMHEVAPGWMSNASPYVYGWQWDPVWEHYIHSTSPLWWPWDDQLWTESGGGSDPYPGGGVGDMLGRSVDVSGYEKATAKVAYFTTEIPLYDAVPKSDVYTGEFLMTNDNIANISLARNTGSSLFYLSTVAQSTDSVYCTTVSTLKFLHGILSENTVTWTDYTTKYREAFQKISPGATDNTIFREIAFITTLPRKKYQDETLITPSIEISCGDTDIIIK